MRPIRGLTKSQIKKGVDYVRSAQEMNEHPDAIELAVAKLLNIPAGAAQEIIDLAAA